MSYGHSDDSLRGKKGKGSRKYSDYSQQSLSSVRSGHTYRSRSYRRDDSYSDSFESDTETLRGKNVNSEATYVKNGYRSGERRTPRRKPPKGSPPSRRKGTSPHGNTGGGKQQDYVTKRMLSARRLKINELRNETETLARDLEDMKQENKLLRTTQQRTSKALERFEDKEGDLPVLIDRHSQEVRSLREQLRKQKGRTDKAERRFRDAQDEAERVRGALRKLEEISSRKQLRERDDLSRRLGKAEEELEEKNKRVKDLEGYVDNLKKINRGDVQKEMKKRLTLEQDLRNTMKSLEYVESQLKEKEKELDIKNIYHHSLVKVQRGDLSGMEIGSMASFRSTPRDSPRKDLSQMSPQERAKQLETTRRAGERKRREKPLFPLKLRLGRQAADLPPPAPSPPAPKDEHAPATEAEAKESDEFEQNRKQLAILEAQRSESRPQQSPRFSPPFLSPPLNQTSAPEPPPPAPGPPQREDSWAAIYSAQEKITTKREDVPTSEKMAANERTQYQQKQEMQQREEKENAAREEERRELFRQQQFKEREQRQREKEEGERKEAEDRIRKAKEALDQERKSASQQMTEERQKKNQLLAKMKSIDQGGQPNGHSNSGDFFLTSGAVDDGFSSSSRKEYKHRNADANLANGFPSQATKEERLRKLFTSDDDSPQSQTSNKKAQKRTTKPKNFLDGDNNNGDDEFGYKPSFGTPSTGSKASLKKSSSQPKSNLLENLFGDDNSSKDTSSVRKSTLGGEDIFTSSTKAKPVADKKAYPWETDVKGSSKARGMASGHAIGGGGRQAPKKSVGAVKPLAKEESFFDDDIEEVIL